MSGKPGGQGPFVHGPFARGQRVLVIVPTYEERANLAEICDGVLAVAPAANILVVDDASPDGTGALADELSRRDPRVHVLHRPAKLGLGSAYKDGFRWALAQPQFSVIFEMDADGSHDPRHLPAFLGALERGADVVVGSRNVACGGVLGWGPGRHLLSKGGSLYARTVLGAPIRDLTTGYKAFTRAALEQLDFDRVQSNGYAFQVETTFRALRRGLRVVEIPIVFVDRRAGHSKMSRGIVVEAILRMWSLRLDALTGRL